MTYTIYNIAIPDRVKEEAVQVWSVLLFADKFHITSEAGFVVLVFQCFPHYAEPDKEAAYGHFRQMLDKRMGYDQAMLSIKQTKELRKKKQKNGLEMKALREMEVWLRKFEKWFMTSLEDFLRQHHYDQLASLGTELKDGPEADVKFFLPSYKLEEDPDSKAIKHYLTFATNALSAGNLFVLDNLVDPYITKLAPSDYHGDVPDGEPIPVFLEKLMEMPICYSLKSNEITMARDTLKQDFAGFHEALSSFSSALRESNGKETSAESFKTGIENLRGMYGGLQEKIDSNAFVINAKNAIPDLITVTLHLGFTTNKALLKIFNLAGMLDEESYLQACTLVEKDSGLNYLRPFIYIAS